jgi:hypothetical protein
MFRAVRLLALLLIAAGAASAAAAPRLTSTFLAISIGAKYDQRQWDREFEAMRKAGVRFVGARAALKGIDAFKPNADCVLGHFEAMYPASVYPAACRRPAGGSPLPRGALEGVLSAANRTGIKVHLGPAIPRVFVGKYEENFNHSLRDAMLALARLHVEVMADVFTVFPDLKHVITGCYTDVELSNDAYSTSPTMLDDAAVYYAAIGRALKTNTTFFGGGMVVWSSPYYIGNLTRHGERGANATVFAEFYARLFAKTKPYFDAIALQDSRGYNGNTNPEVREALAALHARVAVPGLGQVWSNTEMFEGWKDGAPCAYPGPCGRHPAPWARVAAQLANEAPFASQRTAWEWLTCLSPYTNNATALLWKGYMAGTD